jgi:hypothetical protein
MRISDCGLMEDESRAVFNQAFLNPHSEIDKGALAARASSVV